MNKSTKNKWVTIFLPNGSTHQYCTKSLGDSNIEVADTIECEIDQVKIAYKVDNKIEAKAYVRMPYILEIF